MISKIDASALIKGLWSNSGEPTAIGCNGCPDRPTCGGLQVTAPVFSCMDHCNCSDKTTCQMVCPNHANFVSRIHEVRGFGFEDILKRKSVPLLPLPGYAHLLFNHPKVDFYTDLPVATVPLSAVFNRSGRSGAALSRRELENKFRLKSGVPLILTGVELDRKIEKYWGVTRGRDQMIAGIKAINPLIVTTPNYSVGLDAPRHEAMHSLKRIVLAWSELHDAGIRTALHLNAVTSHDYKRMADFLKFHSEIHAVSLEFETGAANDAQGAYHIEQLERLMQTVGRTLHLVFRGDTRWIAELRKVFPSVTIINGSADMRTRKRRRAVYTKGQLSWTSFPTPRGQGLDELMAHNLAKVGEWLADKTSTEAWPWPPVERKKKEPRSEVNSEADHKSTQMSFL